MLAVHVSGSGLCPAVVSQKVCFILLYSFFFLYSSGKACDACGRAKRKCAHTEEECRVKARGIKSIKVLGKRKAKEEEEEEEEGPEGRKTRKRTEMEREEREWRKKVEDKLDGVENVGKYMQANLGKLLRAIAELTKKVEELSEKVDELSDALEETDNEAEKDGVAEGGEEDAEGETEKKDEDVEGETEKKDEEEVREDVVMS